MKIHATITIPRLIDALEDEEYHGFCIACGADAEMCEPDARNYECQVCGKHEVYGAEELMLMMG
jgi:hypothetical protein